LPPNLAQLEHQTSVNSAKQYHEAEYFAMLAHAVSGGIESPLQFVLQVHILLKITNIDLLEREDPGSNPARFLQFSCV
jgi:O-acetylhomoserine/O-acetylserine sulfhydrylase-like pyridoxal-dependent enzyme